jgi:AAA domain
MQASNINENVESSEGEGWPRNLPDYILEDPVQHLLYEEIDRSASVLGNLWWERQSYAVIQGTSGIGKSMLAVQMGVEAALGKEVFGLAVQGPLRVLILQAEDTRNDRIRQSACINRLAVTREETRLISRNLRIMTPRKRAHRGKELFAYLTGAFEEFSFDLLIMNPAFAFLEGNVNESEAVGNFLRGQLQDFLRLKNAAAIVIHHVPKPPKSGRGRTSDSTMYAGHGSAEWANAPRASLTISRTLVPWVFLFDIGKRGSYSGWESDAGGYYTRYFTHSRSGDMFWARASEADISAGTTGVSSDDFFDLFNEEADLTFERIKARFHRLGYNYSDEELEQILEEAVKRGQLMAVEVEGKRVWRPIKKARGGAEKREANYALWMEAVYGLISDAGPQGILTTELRARVSIGNSTLDECLERLKAAGRIVRNPDKRWVAVENPLTVVA